MSEHDHHPPHPPKDKPPTMGGHGMLIVGERSTFLCHFPMFMFDPKDHPHNFQVIMQVTFEPPADGGSAVDYRNDRRQHPEMRLYTFIPDDFEMDHLDPEHRMIDSLAGQVHRGHFERHAQDGGHPSGGRQRRSAAWCSSDLSSGGRANPASWSTCSSGAEKSSS